MLQVKDLTRVYGRGDTAHVAVEGVEFQVAEGELVSIVGPSGCGKSTVLRCIAGLLAPTSGQVVLRGEPVERVPDRLAVVFQEYGRSLYPWLTVRDNVALPLRRSQRNRTRPKRGQLKRAQLKRALVTHDIDESVYVGDRVIVLTPGPGRVRAELTVNLPALRDQITTKALPEFVRLRTDVSRLVRGRPERPPSPPSTITPNRHKSLIDHHFDNVPSAGFHAREMSYLSDRVELRS